MTVDAAHPTTATVRGRAPYWVWLIVIALACIEPLTHVWIACCPPENTVPTGAHTGDSAHHLVCMRMFETGFHSPFATCQSPQGTHHFGFFAPPLFLLYGVLGVVQRAVGADPFLFLGLANGLGGALYLAAAYLFLREAVPRHAHRAFLLFTLGGGLGGALFLLTGALGLHATPQFEEYFRRYAHYELIEGPHLSPVLHMPRLYYTLSLAMALGGLAAFIRAQRDGRLRPALFAGALLFAATWVNLRLGPLAWVIAALYLACQVDRPWRDRLRWAGALAVPVALGAAVAWKMIAMSPAYAGNLVETVRMAMWLSPFVSATVFYCLVVPSAVRHAMPGLPRWPYVAAWAAMAYLAAFAILYAAYQVYWGNVLVCRDTAVAVAMSDWALLGVPVGAAYALWRRGRARSATAGETGWVVLWLLLFLAVAVSAFGQGWFMRLNPQRFMVFLGLPIAILAAEGLARLEAARPRWANGVTASILGCGICSILVGALFFQGPLSRQPGQGPFAYLHYELMTPADAHVLDRLGEGTVVTPPWSPISFGEIVALRPGVSVVGGVGAMNIGDQPFGLLQAQVSAFFEPTTAAAVRERFVRTWCVDYVYCPDTCPVEPLVVEQLRGAPWLTEVAADERAVLFAVEVE